MTEAPTHFERLGLPRRFNLDMADIERNYLERSRAVHPDFYQQSSSARQRVSMEMSAALNDAYATLKQPFRRGEYLLSLEGGQTAAEHKEMAPAFLEEMLELRMEIEELRHSASPQSHEMEAQLNRRIEGLVRDLERWFSELEGIPATNISRRGGVLVEIRRVLNAAKYVQGLLRDLRAD